MKGDLHVASRKRSFRLKFLVILVLLLPVNGMCLLTKNMWISKKKEGSEEEFVDFLSPRLTRYAKSLK